ncbi:hypothetical protein PV328_002294 [Microctonus aethiopoides]|uniref:Methionine--tRNA ligase, cytoplasmic n=1 Tax=Microctonus aethiopoides TaxID=144406 RepID=A0AA39FYR2_9HYME|nr:hypothetical protein PV328_002294 [Microctonus aethiopoides]
MIVSTNESNPNALKLLIACKIAKNSHEINIVQVKPGPLQRLPTLTLSNETTLISSSAAIQYILPIEEKFDILVNKWIEWDMTQLQPALISYGGSGSLDTSHKPRIWSLLTYLNQELKDKTYLINSNTIPSSADISIWCTLWCTIAMTEISKEISKEFPQVDRWLNHVAQLPVIQESLNEFKIERGLKSIASIQAVSWFPMNSYTGGKSSKSVSNDENSVKDKEIDTVSIEEIEVVKKNWSSRLSTSAEQLSYPVLPKKGKRNILITSALPYVNNVPHLGNIIGCVLSADIFARYCRQRNYNTLYICGTDEYGTATEAKAFEEKMTPQTICDKYFNIHNDIYRWFSIGFDYFGRTTTPEQTQIVQDLFLTINSKGYVVKKSIDQLLCQSCDKFLADRFVEGTCPGCKYEDARGDQCDGCGHLINATELINPRCKVCNTTPIVKASTQFFLDLPKLQSKLREWSAASEKGWSSVAKAVARPWFRDELKERCITRDLKWGVPVPLDGYRDKVFYVWFDAPLGYLSITKRYTKEYEQWWKPKDIEVNLYQFMAKDNVPFHAIMFPASLLAADQGHTLVKHIMATEYLNYEDTKFSKSRGTGVFGTDARDTGIPSDIWRFYLAYIRPEMQDSNFNWADLAMKNNSELLNNFGNFVNRSLMFAEKNFNLTVPEMTPRVEDYNFLALIQRELIQYNESLEISKMRDALRCVLAISKHGNQYMQSQQPWVKVKGTEEDKKAAGTVIGICCNVVCLLSSLISPFMPNTAREMRSQLGLDINVYGYISEFVALTLPAGHKLGKPSPLFARIEDAQIETLKIKYGGKQQTETPETSKTAATKDERSIASLEEEISKQGLLVRELKAKQDKSVWAPQVKILLDLKKKLADLTEASSKPVNSATINAKKSETDKSPTKNDEQNINIAALNAKITEQGLLVRELKAKEAKSVWQPQVEILLKLKKELADLGGAITPNPGDKKSKKKK